MSVPELFVWTESADHVQWHPLSPKAIGVSVVCFCFLVFWGCWRRELPINPSCASTTGVKFDADFNHCPQNRVRFENWWGVWSHWKLLLIWSKEIMKGSEALVYEVEFFSAHIREAAGQERRKWGFFHSWHANNRRITCCQHLDVIWVHLVSKLAICLTQGEQSEGTESAWKI